jgi:hypothetical protein
VSEEPRSPTLEELLALKDGLRRLPGWKPAAEIRALDRSRRLFDGNVKELQRFLGEHSEPPRVLELWAMNNRKNFDLFLEEVDRLLHNFVAAALSLRDHSLRVRGKLLPASDADQLAQEYEARSVAAFDEPLPRFVLDLRQFSQHRRLPITSGHASGRRVGEVDDASARFEFESRIVLHPSDLLQWKKWKPASCSFIDSAGDDIAVEEVVSEYATVVDSFHAWFREALLTRHRESLAELKLQAAEVQRRYEKAFGPVVQDPIESADLG